MHIFFNMEHRERGGIGVKVNRFSYVPGQEMDLLTLARCILSWIPLKSEQLIENHNSRYHIKFSFTKKVTQPPCLSSGCELM